MIEFDWVRFMRSSSQYRFVGRIKRKRPAKGARIHARRMKQKQRSRR